MLAWKFLAPGAIAPFTGIRWPQPEGSRIASWVEGRAAPARGVHACAVADLPYWFDVELWEVELEGPVTRAARQLMLEASSALKPGAGMPSSVKKPVTLSRSCSLPQPVPMKTAPSVSRARVGPIHDRRPAAERNAASARERRSMFSPFRR